GVVKYNSTARSRSSRPDIRKSFRSVSKKTSAAPYRDATLLKERDREPLAKSVSDEEGAWVFTTWTSSRTAWVR
ncbi:MAG: hypothetical protein E7H24_09720, partial [Bifidobacterium breve]|nr:hypothetical protein [Bifidobacterium breve]MDU4035697.1 hypothetical protein [Bifidobacterium breve]MDU8948594.1 hypothetical protein [Bifidobacterium breve]